jgi:SSS family solute:Na+ symporter/sodium/pantothenate symporter
MTDGWTPFLMLLAVIAGSVWLGTAAQRAVKGGSFLKGYFLGNRGLGAWAMALTATVQSGGTFMGFPGLVYRHGWVTAFWIAGYAILPITAFAILGKRLAQMSRKLGALTVPDFLRERYGCRWVGLMASIFIVIFLTIFMLAQFKAGAIIMKVAFPGAESLALAEDVAIGTEDRAYRFGLALFTVSVIAYTLIGGFLGAVWTDLLQSVLMFVGVVLLLGLTLWASGGPERATRLAMETSGPDFVFAPGAGDFLPLSMAVSMFVFWNFAGMGVPASLVRVMACKDTTTLRRSIVLIGVYNLFIYLPLIVIAICGRALFPALKSADEIIPRLAIETTRGIPGGSLLGGLILAAPFGAVMATVSTFLVVVASGVVRDIYQRFINPAASDRTLKWVSRGTILAVGVVSVVASLKPPAYLQKFIVMGGGGAAAAFLVPVLMGLYWRRATAAGAFAAMFFGASAVLLMNLYPIPRLGFDPFIWGLALSAAAGFAFSLGTKPPPEPILAPLFDGA